MRFVSTVLLAAVFAVATANLFAKPSTDAQMIVGAFSFGVGLFVLGKLLRRL